MERLNKEEFINEWIKAGYSLEEATILAEDSIKYKDDTTSMTPQNKISDYLYDIVDITFTDRKTGKAFMKTDFVNK